MKRFELLSDKYYKKLKTKDPGFDLYEKFQYSKYMELLHTIGLTKYCALKDNLHDVSAPYYFDMDVASLWYWCIIIIPIDNKRYNAYVFQRKGIGKKIDIYYFELTRKYGYLYNSQMLESKFDFEFDFCLKYIRVLQSKPNAEVFKYSYEMAYPVICHNIVYECLRVEKMDDRINSLARARDSVLESYSKLLEDQTAMEKKFEEWNVSIEDLRL